MDSLQDFRRWKAYDRILSDYKLLVFPRKGFDGGDFATHPSVTVLETPLIEVSSSLKNALAARFLPGSKSF